MTASYRSVRKSRRTSKPLTKEQDWLHRRLCSLMREARLNADLTLQEMSDRTDVSYGWLSSMELGEKGRTAGGANGRFIGIGIDLVRAYEDACGLKRGTLAVQAGYGSTTPDDLIDQVRLALSNRPAVAQAIVAALTSAFESQEPAGR